MKKGQAIAAEWKHIAPGLHLPDEAPFSVPEGYFTALPEQVMQRIRHAENDEVETILNGLPKVNPLSQPAPAYFNQLSAQVLQRIHQENAGDALEEAREVDRILTGLPKNNPFTPAPPTYFAQLGSQVMEHIRQAEGPGKIVVLPARKSWIKWAVAACSIGVLATVGTFLLRNNTISLDTQLSKISDQELVDYLQTHTDEFDNDAIYANVATTTPATGKEAAHALQIEDISTDDLNQYIESTKTNGL
ncbi:hypothetical protein GA0116948_10627 [Chitinophaga costaii]|uniref:Uncharacterized protein n=1 Tax=Chitinophaga costaii TaxID=1335309 RepID=A0A1C4DPH8_9BACT|nr:hypothetical protein [Chitinophaga costaii]PUZ27722.1 hypothetical protein DCM91_05785 [Chitinophaga costaii]SCC33135.1 hypothetical protein GA0116948_10627 [Chitinophaga costaii]